MELHTQKFRIAGFDVAITMRWPYTAKKCADYRIADDAPAELSVSATDEEIEREYESGGGRFSLPYCESICIYRRLCVELPVRGGVMFHSSAVRVDGEGYAFFGRSGAGKSTHTALWKKLLGERLVVVNGDKPIYRINGDAVTAYGSPWSGKENEQTNTSAVLRAICLIKQAKTNSIRRLSPDEAAQAVIGQVLIPRDADSAAATLEFLDALVKLVPVWELSCDISEEAARLSFETMKGADK